MSGRRLLDASKLFNAARSVARQYVVLRSEQLENYNKTSSLTKAVKEQTDRVTLTAQAAISLARRLNESEAPNSTSQYTHPATYGSSQSHDVRSPERQQTTIVGEFAPASSLLRTELAPDTARRLQRESESQIPSETSSAAPKDPSESGIQAGIDHDVHFDRGRTPNKDYSSLPRSKIPKHTQASNIDSHDVKEAGVDSDVFPTPVSEEVENVESETEDDNVPEGVDVEVFRTARVSKLLGSQTGKNAKVQGILGSESSTPQDAGETPLKAEFPSSELESVGAEDLVESAAKAEVVDKVPFHMRESRVPSSRIGRLWEYSGLATSMAFGVVGETLRRASGSGASGPSLMLSPANMERLVVKLSRMRGAALKLGQMVSFQGMCITCFL
jgi:aarF domain-containing kinase